MDKNRIREAVLTNGDLNAFAVGTIPAATAPPLIDAESVRKEAETFLENTSEGAPGLFVLKSANKWMEESKLRPAPRMLFGEFWYENEVCILFSDTNLGKSILAVQIAESIASGRQFEKFFPAPKKQKVLYFDFELSSVLKTLCK